MLLPLGLALVVLTAPVLDEAAPAGATLGPRPMQELARALAHLDFPEVCLGGGDALVELEVLAAGYVDRIWPLVLDDSVDVPCLERALRALAFDDRGREPLTRVILHLGAHAPALPPSALVATLPRDERMRACLDAEPPQSSARGSNAVWRFRVESGRVVQAEPSQLHQALSAASARCMQNALAHVVFDDRSLRGVGAWRYRVPPAPELKRAPSEPETLFGVLGCSPAVPSL